MVAWWQFAIVATYHISRSPLFFLRLALESDPLIRRLSSVGSAVQGTDNGVYLTTANLPGLYPWGSMAGSTSSSPSMCNSWVQGLGGGLGTVVVRGTDNSIYAKPIGWAGSWFSLPAGATHLQPVCAFTTAGLSSTLHVVVVGTDNALYYTNCAEPCSSNGSGWSAWQSLGGATNSVPALVATTPGRLDLLVRGTDNGVYHKAYTNGAWALSWDKIRAEPLLILQQVPFGYTSYPMGWVAYWNTIFWPWSLGAQTMACTGMFLRLAPAQVGAAGVLSPGR